MEGIHDILVPAFANDVLAKSRCENCEGSLEDAWVRAAGVRLDDENRACFWASVWCRACEQRRDILFTSYHAVREEWWQDIACWVGDAARPDRVHQVLSNLHFLSGASILLSEKGKTKRLNVYGAYAGEVGPVVFLYRWTTARPGRSYGVARLESHNRLRFLPIGDREALPVSRWLWFAGLASETSFIYRRRSWTKLPLNRIRDIVLDRVFEPWVGRRRPRRK